jgi:chemotaxis protein histidine kinase CheA
VTATLFKRSDVEDEAHIATIRKAFRAGPDRTSNNYGEAMPMMSQAINTPPVASLVSFERGRRSRLARSPEPRPAATAPLAQATSAPASSSVPLWFVLLIVAGLGALAWHALELETRVKHFETLSNVSAQAELLHSFQSVQALASASALTAEESAARAASASEAMDRQMGDLQRQVSAASESASAATNASLSMKGQLQELGSRLGAASESARSAGAAAEEAALSAAQCDEAASSLAQMGDKTSTEVDGAALALERTRKIADSVDAAVQEAVGKAETAAQQAASSAEEAGKAVSIAQKAAADASTASEQAQAGGKAAEDAAAAAAGASDTATAAQAAVAEHAGEMESKLTAAREAAASAQEARATRVEESAKASDVTDLALELRALRSRLTDLEASAEALRTPDCLVGAAVIDTEGGALLNANPRPRINGTAVDSTAAAQVDAGAETAMLPWQDYGCRVAGCGDVAGALAAAHAASSNAQLTVSPALLAAEGWNGAVCFAAGEAGSVSFAMPQAPPSGCGRGAVSKVAVVLAADSAADDASVVHGPAATPPEFHVTLKGKGSKGKSKSGTGTANKLGVALVQLPTSRGVAAITVQWSAQKTPICLSRVRVFA